MRSETSEAAVWIAEMLKADSQLIPIFGSGDTAKVFVEQAVRDFGFPYILITFMSGIDKDGLGIKRQLTTANFQVRIVTLGPPTENDRVAEHRMDDLLQSAVNAPSGGYIMSSRRIAPINRPEYDALKQVRYQNIGGLYRIRISKAP